MKALQGMLTGWSIYNIIILLICIANIVIQIRIGIIEENWNISAICGWTGATIAYIQLIWFTNFL